MMDSLSTHLREFPGDLFLVGATAHQFAQTGTWPASGYIEAITTCSRTNITPFSDKARWSSAISSKCDVLALEGEQGELHLHLTYLPHSLTETQLTQYLARRGFRIETCALHWTEQTIIDPFDAIKANEEQAFSIVLAEKEKQSFETSTHRGLAACRIVANFGIPLPDQLQDEITANATKLLFAPRSRWLQGMTEILCGTYVQAGLQALYETRQLGMILPEVEQMVGFAERSAFHHKDLWKHTKQVVEQAPAVPLVRWAALLHDVGKVWTRTYTETGKVHFFHHEEHGAQLVEGIGARLHFPGPLQDDLAFIVRHHQRPTSYDATWSDAAVRRLHREMGPRITPLLQLSAADCTSGNPQRREAVRQQAQELKARVAKLAEQDSQLPPLPSGIGQVIMETLQIAPGPYVGRIKRWLLQEIQDERLLPHQETTYYQEFLLTDTAQATYPKE